MTTTPTKAALEFTVDIQAPRAAVWEAMLGPDTYRDWTSAFCEGSYYEGSWAQGGNIRFLTPNGDGMSAVIAENRPLEFVSIRHLGEISGGVEDLTSEKVRAWAPAHENFHFSDIPGGTRVRVTMDTVGDYEQYMKDTYPKSLQRLKAICEAGR